MHELSDIDRIAIYINSNKKQEGLENTKITAKVDIFILENLGCIWGGYMGLISGLGYMAGRPLSPNIYLYNWLWAFLFQAQSHGNLLDPVFPCIKSL